MRNYFATAKRPPFLEECQHGRPCPGIEESGSMKNNEATDE